MENYTKEELYILLQSLDIYNAFCAKKLARVLEPGTKKEDTLTLKEFNDIHEKIQKARQKTINNSVNNYNNSFK